MDEERSAGAVVFYRNPRSGSIEYLLLHYEEKHWDFPKGHIEHGEKPIEAMLREVKEETGLDVDPVFGFNEKIDYVFRARYDNNNLKHKVVEFFLASAPKKKVSLSSEHVAYEWLPYKLALERITHENSRRVLKAADTFLRSVYNK
ncbi:MAG: NUDIX domain-containing protein [Candidatus Micrarchaeota archaeon]|nr:NUDIX domain-containing protein [Candidatus Micrarchaeota archaeon]